MRNPSQSVIAYKVIRDRIIALDAGLDEETLADTLEGATDLNEVVAAVVRAALDDEALAAGLKGRIEALEARHKRLSERARARRRLARDAMVEVDLKRVTAPDFTVTVRRGAPQLTVTDEGAIPEIYWVPRDPRLDRQRLRADLAHGKSVAGALLGNPAPTLSVRTV